VFSYLLIITPGRLEAEVEGSTARLPRTSVRISMSCFVQKLKRMDWLGLQCANSIQTITRSHREEKRGKKRMLGYGYLKMKAFIWRAQLQSGKPSPPHASFRSSLVSPMIALNDDLRLSCRFFISATRALPLLTLTIR